MVDVQVPPPASHHGELDFQVQQGEPGGVVLLVADGPCNDLGPITLTMPHEDWVAIGAPNTLRAALEARCDGCGCTDSEACAGGCSWAAPALCSSCV